MHYKQRTSNTWCHAWTVVTPFFLVDEWKVHRITYNIETIRRGNLQIVPRKRKLFFLSSYTRLWASFYVSKSMPIFDVLSSALFTFCSDIYQMTKVTVERAFPHSISSSLEIMAFESSCTISRHRTCILYGGYVASYTDRKNGLFEQLNNFCHHFFKTGLLFKVRLTLGFSFNCNLLTLKLEIFCL